MEYMVVRRVSMSYIKHPEGLDRHDAYFLFGWLQGLCARLKSVNRSSQGGKLQAEIAQVATDTESMLSSYQSVKEKKDGKKDKS